MTEDSIGRLREIAAGCAALRFRPAGVFVAHCGVLTVVFEGFDACTLAMKDEIDRALPGLEEEHEGSMWPKVSLAVLRDDQRLNEAEVLRLREIADEWDPVIRSRGSDVVVEELLAVEYGCRSLEIRTRTERLPLLAESANPEVPPHHSRFVRSVLAQFSMDRLREYTVAIDRAGHRESHYRESATGWSLIAELLPSQLPYAPGILESARRAVPGKYAPFAPESWHVTIRTLDHVPAGSAAQRDEGD